MQPKSMKFQISLTQEGDKFVVGIDAPEAFCASGDTPLQALRKWIHSAGNGIVKYRNGEIGLERLAERLGVSEEEALQLAQIETLVPEMIAPSPKSNRLEDNN